MLHGHGVYRLGVSMGRHVQGGELGLHYWSFGLWSDAKVMGKNFMIIRSCYWTAKRRLKDQDKCT